MHLALSPYHLTTREPAAMAGLLLATRATTLLPVPLGGLSKAEVRRAMHESPAYLRVLESWRWCGALWRSGVIDSLHQREDAIVDAREADRDLAHDEAWSALAHFHRDELAAKDRSYLDALCADLLKGGPDPGLSVPVVAGMDRLATRHHLVALRSGAPGRPSAGGAGPSLTQRAESLMGEAVASFAMPVFTAASGGTLVDARRRLEGTLAPLREAIAAAWDAPSRTAAQSRVRAAAAAFAEAFARVADALTGHDDDLGKRVTIGRVRVDMRILPAQAALLAALAALSTAQARARGGGAGARAAGAQPGSGVLRALVVTPMA